MSWKVAVTGASGQIGSALCRELVRQGYEVNALVRNDCPAINGLPLKVCSGNVLDKDSLIRLMDECNVVIHTAANIKRIEKARPHTRGTLKNQSPGS